MVDKYDASIEQYRRDINRLEHKVRTEFRLGPQVPIIAVCMILIALSFFAPHIAHHFLTFGIPEDSATGYDILLRTQHAHAQEVSPFGWFFLAGMAGFGLFTSMLALFTRRWWLAVITEWGGALTTSSGVLAIWLRQSRPDQTLGGATIWLVATVLIMLLFTLSWVRLVWTRSAEQLQLENAKRLQAQQQESSFQAQILKRDVDSAREDDDDDGRWVLK